MRHIRTTFLLGIVASTQLTGGLAAQPDVRRVTIKRLYHVSAGDIGQLPFVQKGHGVDGSTDVANQLAAVIRTTVDQVGYVANAFEINSKPHIEQPVAGELRYDATLCKSRSAADTPEVGAKLVDKSGALMFVPRKVGASQYVVAISDYLLPASADIVAIQEALANEHSQGEPASYTILMSVGPCAQEHD